VLNWMFILARFVVRQGCLARFTVNPRQPGSYDVLAKDIPLAQRAITRGEELSVFHPDSYLIRMRAVHCCLDDTLTLPQRPNAVFEEVDFTPVEVTSSGQHLQGLSRHNIVQPVAGLFFSFHGPCLRIPLASPERQCFRSWNVRPLDLPHIADERILDGALFYSNIAHIIFSSSKARRA